MDENTAFPTLETERLILRQMTAADAAGLLALYSRPEVTRFIDVDTLQTLGQAEELIASLDALHASGMGLRWGVFALETGELIGTCGFHDWDRCRMRAEISYDLGSHYWGQGFMREALLAALNHGFTSMKLHRVEALVDPADTRSQNLLYGLGYKLEGILRDHDYIKGRYMDDMMFALLSQEWVKQD